MPNSRLDEKLESLLDERVKWAVIAAGATLGIYGLYKLALGGVRKPPGEPQEPAEPRQALIILDPGHGGSDPGARGPIVGYAVHRTNVPVLYEKDVNLDLVKRVGNKLEAIGIRVIYTRTTDTTVSVQTRRDLICKYHPHAFVSVHMNSTPNVDGYGDCSVNYTLGIVPGGSYENSLSNTLASKIVSEVAHYLGTSQQIAERTDLGVLTQNCAASTIIEPAFICNPDFRLKWGPKLFGWWPSYNRFRDGLASAIAEGIIQYLGVAR